MNANPAMIRRARAVFHCALELEGDERELFVADACGDDAELLDMTLRLLAADQSDAGSFSWSAPVRRQPGSVADDAGRRHLQRPSGYTHLRELGEGGSGVVELCRDDASGDLVAIKTIDLRGLGGGGVDRVRREWRILGSLSHEALVALRAAGMLEDRYAYLVMDFIDGLDIRAHCEMQALDAGSVVGLLLPVAEALALAHSRGVVHRDLKPSNILVDGLGAARLLDFGAARISVGGAVSVHHHTLAGEMVGTLTYMSPEQAGGRANEVDGRTDIYQLAVVLYELIEGRPPYELDGLTFAETISAIVRTKPAPMAREPRDGGAEPALARVVMKALSKRPASRYRDMASFIRALARATRLSRTALLRG